MENSIMDTTEGEPPPYTERTALLDESSVSPTSNHDAHHERQTDEDVANVLVSPLRGVAIGLSLGLLIFLQGVHYYIAQLKVTMAYESPHSNKHVWHDHDPGPDCRRH